MNTKQGNPKDYPKSYGYGLSESKPDLSKCAEGMSHRFAHYQCRSAIWKDSWCKRHHPTTKAERQEKARERFDEGRRLEKLHTIGWALGYLREMGLSDAANAEIRGILEKEKQA